MFIFNIHSRLLKFTWLLSIFCTCSVTVFSQSSRGLLKGKVVDGSTYQPLFGAAVQQDLSSRFSISSPDGEYFLKVSKGTKKVSFKAKGFQTKIISDIKITSRSITYLDIVLFPISASSNTKVKSKKNGSDSIKMADTLITKSFSAESKSMIYFPFEHKSGSGNIISSKNIQPGIDKDATSFLKRLNGVSITNVLFPGQLTSFNINGMGERYNQLMLNGAVISSADQFSRAYATDIVPIEFIDRVSVTHLGDAALPGDFTGGTIAVKTKDLPDQNFFYIQGGLSFYDETTSKNFFSDKGSTGQFFSYPGSVRNLPTAFPTTRSIVALNQNNLQEQIYHSQILKNNLAPVNNGASKPNNKFSIGFGKLYQYKKAITIGVIGFINQQKSELIATNAVQVSTNAASNPFPFADLSKILIRSESYDSNYTYSSQLNAALNATVLYGRNKISIKTLYGNQFINLFSRRTNVSAPDADPSASNGIYYKTEQRQFINAQLSGEHALGANSKLKFDWVASYAYYRQQNPDERNFILRSDTTGNNSFEIGSRAGAANDIINTGRLWRNLTEHNYTGAFNLSFPFNMFGRPQVLGGGILISSRYRVTYSDLLITKSSGYFPLDNLLAPEQYFPGRLSVTNYFSNNPTTNLSSRNLNDRAGYVASANLGAAYLKLENKITGKLMVSWGLRAESNSQLVSSTAYNYTQGFRYPQLRTLDVNLTTNKFSLLPSVQANYDLLNNVHLQAVFFRTVNRPQLQELSIIRYYDAASFLIRTGNQQLRSSHIENYNAGFTWLLNSKSSFSAAGFYKKIDQPIENILSAYGQGTMISQPFNMPPATVQGITASLNLKLYSASGKSWLSGINFFASGTYTDSKVQAGPLKSTATASVAEHTLSGTPTYSVNTGFIFEYPRLPQLTVLYNQTGDYITAVGSGTEVILENGNKIASIPDYRVKGYGQLDIQVSQKLFKSTVQITAGVNNLLNENYTVYQDLNGNKKMDEQLLLGTLNNNPGFYRSGVDNTITNIKTQKNYYLTLSFLFR